MRREITIISKNGRYDGKIVQNQKDITVISKNGRYAGKAQIKTK